WARLTVTPFCNMGVMTMKMINNTSMTSTIGVTLMLELTLEPSSLFEIAIFRLLRRWTRRIGCAGSCNSRRGQRASARHAQAFRPCVRDHLSAHSSPTLQEVVDQFARRVVHFHVERFHAAGQVVEHHDGGNRHQ